MIVLLLLFVKVTFLGALCSAESLVYAVDPKVEYLRNPLAVDSSRPRLSWIVGKRGVDGQLLYNTTQSAYQILAASNPRILLDQPDMWDSGKVSSTSHVHIKYEGKIPDPGNRVYWTVRIWDQEGHVSSYITPSFWESGYFESLWNAKWISAPDIVQRKGLKNLLDEDQAVVKSHPGLKPVIYLRTIFPLDADIKQSKVYATAQGLYKLFINGEIVHRDGVKEELFSPGWTDYNKSIQYQVYDVTKLMGRENTIGVMLATGWFSGYVGFRKGYQYYGKRESFLMELHIEYKNGSREIISTKSTWKATAGSLIYSDFLQGELVYEDRSLYNWLNYDYDDSNWSNVNSVIINREISLIAERSDPVEELDLLNAIEAWELSPGVWIYDFGVNIAGYVRINLEKFKSKTVIQVRHGEVLNPNRTLYTLNLREARAIDRYLLNNPSKRDESLVLKPHFTYHGFRYVEVSGYPERFNKWSENGSTIAAVKIGLREIRSQIVTDNKMVNTLFQNIRTSNLANFISVPTDCPQRDERLGWLGDAQVFVQTGMYNGEVAGFYSKWLRDLREAQTFFGAFSNVAPKLVDTLDGGPGWGDAGVIITWHLYRMYGDIGIIEENYHAMKNFVEYILALNKDLIWSISTGINLGDWLSVGEFTSPRVSSTAYFAYDSLLLSKMAKAIGNMADAEKYKKLHADISSAFVKEFVNTTDYTIQSNTQTAYILAVAFQILPPELIPKALNKLVENIERHDWHLTTGFIGVGFLLPVLSEYGYNDVAYKLLLQTSYPSWGFMIENGATSMWERWNGYSKEKGVQGAGMNSFNHYSFGSVGRWLYQYMVGIDTDDEEVGFEKIIIKPYIGLGVNNVSAVYNSVQGAIKVDWTVNDKTFYLKTEVPSKAVIILPFLKEKWIKEVPVGSHSISVKLD